MRRIVVVSLLLAALAVSIALLARPSHRRASPAPAVVGPPRVPPRRPPAALEAPDPDSVYVPAERVRPPARAAIALETPPPGPDPATFTPSRSAQTAGVRGGESWR